MKRRTRKRRPPPNPAARSLSRGRYRPQVVASARHYRRRSKHRLRPEDSGD